MWSLTKLIGLVILPLMIGSAVLGSLNTLKAEGVDEDYSAMDAILERENNKLVVNQQSIDRANSNEYFTSDHPETEIFRDVIAINQISAISCTQAAKLISGKMIYANVKEDSTEVERNDDDSDKEVQAFEIGIPEDTKERINEAAGQDPEDGDAYKKTPFHTFPGRSAPNPFYEQAPNYAVQFTDYSPRCVGVQEVETALPSDDILTDPVGYVVDGTIDTVLSAPGDIWNYFSCAQTPGWAKSSGNDMEGRYGRIPFKISEDLDRPVVLASQKSGEIRRDAVWMANYVVSEQDETCWQGYVAGGITAVGVVAASGTLGATGNAPAAATVAVVGAGVISSYDWGSNEIELIPTLAGVDFARYAPYDINVIEGDANWPGINLKLGHVVVDAPIVLEDGDDDENYIESPDDEDDKGLRFMERAKYVLCPGTEGYIQTNRDGDGRKGGEHTVDKDNMPSEDATKMTTYIRVTGGNPESCLEDGGNYVHVVDYVTKEYFEDYEVD